MVTRRYILSGGAAVAVMAADAVFGAGGSLLTALLFWSAVIPGTLALAAAAELSGGKWIEPVKKRLLGFHPFLVMFPILFLYFCRHLEIYGWHDNRTAWLNPESFTIRNTVLLILLWAMGHAYARSSAKESAKTSTFACLYLLVFAASQSLIAFDWVMSFEAPWISTLFGGYFFTESFYAGICVLALVSVKAMKTDPGTHRPILRDASTFLFGFALLWAGLFYAQHLVIWYGNIPEEVHFIYKRVVKGGLNPLAAVIVAALFVIPFAALIPRGAKTNRAAVTALTAAVFAGILLERLFFLLPVTDIGAIPAAVYMILMGIPVGGYVVKSS